MNGVVIVDTSQNQIQAGDRLSEFSLEFSGFFPRFYFRLFSWSLKFTLSAALGPLYVHDSTSEHNSYISIDVLRRDGSERYLSGGIRR